MGKMITACGVDPGMHGAIAVIRPDGTAIAFEMPGTPKELARLFIDRLLPMKIDHAIIEGLHARPGNGSISTFKLAQIFVSKYRQRRRLCLGQLGDLCHQSATRRAKPLCTVR